MPGEGRIGRQQFIEFVRTGKGTHIFDESDGNEVVLVLVDQVHIEIGILLQRGTVLRDEFLHPGFLLFLGKGFEGFNDLLVRVIGIRIAVVTVAQPVVQVRTGKRIVREVHFHGHAVVEKHERPVIALRGQVQEGILRRPSFELKDTAGDNRAVDGRVTEFVDETDHDAVLGTGPVHDILHSFLGAGGRHRCEDGGSKKH